MYGLPTILDGLPSSAGGVGFPTRATSSKARLPVTRGLGLWLKGDSLKNRAYGTTINRWKDDSGYGRDVVGPLVNVCAGAPTLAIGRRHQPLIHCDGVTQGLGHGAASGAIGDADDFSLFMVGDISSIYARGITNIDWSINVSQTSYSQVVLGVQYDCLYTTTPSDLNSQGLVLKTATYSQPNGALSYYINNRFVASATILIGDRGPLRGCANHDIMGITIDGVGIQCKVGELIVFNRLLTTTERGVISRYLRRRWHLRR